MKLPRRTFLHLAAGATALPATSRFAWAQAWPARNVRIVVGLAPGGGVDAVARILANRLSEIWGQPVVVENKSGASGNLANAAVANATPDGYTILLHPSAPGLKRLLFSSLSYNPETDFAPVTLIDKYPYLLVVPNSSPAKSLQEFVAHAKSAS